VRPAGLPAGLTPSGAVPEPGGREVGCGRGRRWARARPIERCVMPLTRCADVGAIVLPLA